MKREKVSKKVPKPQSNFTVQEKKMLKKSMSMQFSVRMRVCAKIMCVYEEEIMTTKQVIVVDASDERKENQKRIIPWIYFCVYAWRRHYLRLLKCTTSHFTGSQLHRYCHYCCCVTVLKCHYEMKQFIFFYVFYAICWFSRAFFAFIPYGMGRCIRMHDNFEIQRLWIRCGNECVYIYLCVGMWFHFILFHLCCFSFAPQSLLLCVRSLSLSRIHLARSFFSFFNSDQKLNRFIYKMRTKGK